MTKPRLFIRAGSGRTPGLCACMMAAASPAVAMPAWGQDDVSIQTIGQLSDIIRWSGVFSSIVLVVGAWLLLRLLSRSVQVFGGQFSARRLTLQKIYTIAQFAIYVTSTFAVVLLSFKIDDTTLALIGGSMAVAVGFAMKDLVASYIAGLIIMLDRPFQVGDRVNFGGEYGDITAIGLRSVRMQTLDDNTVTIPNSKFLSEVTSSGNYGALDMQVTVDFRIAPDQDIDRARDIVNEAALSSRQIFLGKPVVVLITQWNNQYLSGVQIRLKAYVLDTRFEKEFESDISQRVLREFRHEGISLPGQALPEPATPAIRPGAQ